MKRALLLLLVLSYVTGAVLAQDGERLSQDEINRIVQSVVMVVAPVGGDEYSVGSGTIISPDGLIYTNRHVIEGGLDYMIYMLNDVREPAVHRYYASIVGVSDQLDFAVLKIDRDIDGNSINTATLNLPYIEVSPEEVQIGERIQVFGFPTIGDGYMVLTSGEITTVQNGSIGQDRMPVWYQTNTEISPGNSGGLAVNMNGQMVGIPTAVKVEERTGGRLGGILPSVSINAIEISKPSTSVVPANEATFTLVNESDQIICYVFISPVSSTAWGEDQLGPEEVVMPGMARSWDVQAGYYDLLLRDCDTEIIEDQRNLEVQSASTFTYHGTSQPQQTQPGGPQVPLTLVNQSDQVICYVFISPVTATTWGSDQLGSDEVIMAGASRTWNVDADYYDILLQNCNGETLDDQRNVEVLSASTFTYGIDSLSQQGQPSGQQVPLTLVNQSDQVICYVFISPVTATSWGDDQLGSDEVIVAGASRTWNVAADYYDILLRDCDGEVLDDQRNLEVLLPFTLTFAPGATGMTGSSTTFTGGVSVTCDDGVEFNNGVEVIIREVRSGYNYTATAIGINGFDPVLAVFNNVSGQGVCLDDADSSVMSSFSAQLPTTGLIQGRFGSSQITFSQDSGQGLADMSVIVGGYGDMAGEFILLIEGMASTPEDNAGDPISVVLTPGLIHYGLPLSVYMIAETSELDPLIYLADNQLQPQVDSVGESVVCDDAGTPQCWGESFALNNSAVSFAQGMLPGGNLDAMLAVPLDGFEPDIENPSFLTFVMTSFNRQTTGRYVVAIHAATQ